MSIIDEIENKFGKIRKTNRGFSLISCSNNFIVPIKKNFNVNFCYPIANLLVITAVNDSNKKLSGTSTWSCTCNTNNLVNFIEYYAKNCKRTDIGYIDKKTNKIVTKEKAINDFFKTLKENNIDFEQKGNSVICKGNGSKVILELPDKIDNNFSLWCSSCRDFFDNGKEVLNYLNKLSNSKDIIKEKINEIEEKDPKVRVTKTSKPFLYELSGYGSRAIIRFDKSKLNFYYKNVRNNEFDESYWSYLETDKAGKLLRKAKRDNILYKDDGTAYYANEVKLDLSGKKDLQDMDKLLESMGRYVSTEADIKRKTLHIDFNQGNYRYNIVSHNGKFNIEYKNRFEFGSSYSTIKKNLTKEQVFKWIKNNVKSKVESSFNLNKYLYKGRVVVASSKSEVVDRIVSSKMSLKDKIDNAKDFNTKKIKIKDFKEFCTLVLDNWHKGEYETEFESMVRRKFKDLWNKKFKESAKEEWERLEDYYYGNDLYSEEEFLDSVWTIVDTLHKDSNYGTLRDAYEDTRI